MHRTVALFTASHAQNFRMPTLQEKHAFAERLKEALARSPDGLMGPTRLANAFSRRHPGDSPVTPQTTHKWLSGQAIPSRDKLRTLSEWLGVSEHWLHYGPPPRSRALPPDADYPLTTEALVLARKIEGLSPRQRDLVQELVATFQPDTPPRK